MLMKFETRIFDRNMSCLFLLANRTFLANVFTRPTEHFWLMFLLVCDEYFGSQEKYPKIDSSDPVGMLPT